MAWASRASSKDMGVDPGPLIAQAETSVMEGERKLDYFKIRMEDWIERSDDARARRTHRRHPVDRRAGRELHPARRVEREELRRRGARPHGHGREVRAGSGRAGQERGLPEGGRQVYPSCSTSSAAWARPTRSAISNSASRRSPTTSRARSGSIRSNATLDALGLAMRPDAGKAIRSAYPGEEADTFNMFLVAEDLPADRRALAVRLLSGLAEREVRAAERDGGLHRADAAAEARGRAADGAGTPMGSCGREDAARARRRSEPDRRRTPSARWRAAASRSIS